MALAKEELRNGTRSIKEIAFNIRFQSSSAFSTAFTRSIGCSPKRYVSGNVVRQNDYQSVISLTPSNMGQSRVGLQGIERLNSSCATSRSGFLAGCCRNG
jgi:AraC-like DNA-binding protein